MVTTPPRLAGITPLSLPRPLRPLASPRATGPRALRFTATTDPRLRWVRERISRAHARPSCLPAPVPVPGWVTAVKHALTGGGQACEGTVMVHAHWACTLQGRHAESPSQPCRPLETQGRGEWLLQGPGTSSRQWFWDQPQLGGPPPELPENETIAWRLYGKAQVGPEHVDLAAGGPAPQAAHTDAGYWIDR